MGFFSSIFRGRDAPIPQTTKKITTIHRKYDRFTQIVVYYSHSGFLYHKAIFGYICIKTDIHSKRRLQKEGMD